MVRRDVRRTELPLLAWGEQLRAAKQRRKILVRRAAVTGAGVALICLTTAFPPSPRLVWNASASAPLGLYAVSPGASIDAGDMVVARAPQPWRMLAAQRRYIPANVPLVKRVAAVAGDEVCAVGADVFINAKWVTERRIADALGRQMLWWNGCVRLRGHQLFLLMPGSPASFDGRYFGVTEGADVTGKVRLLWAKPTQGSNYE